MKVHNVDISFNPKPQTDTKNQTEPVFYRLGLSTNSSQINDFTMSLHIVMKVLLKRMQNWVNVLVAKLCFSRVPVSCGEDWGQQELTHVTDKDKYLTKH